MNLEIIWKSAVSMAATLQLSTRGSGTRGDLRPALGRLLRPAAAALLYGQLCWHAGLSGAGPDNREVERSLLGALPDWTD